MGEALPEDAWSKEFQTANARPLLSSLQRRLQASTTHVHALAELYRERALIEQEYSAKLGKLARSAEAGQLLGKNGTEWDRNGGEAKLWDAVLSDIQETASAHSTLASTLKSDFEGPVHDLPNKIVPWRRIHDQESSLDRALKDHDKVSVKYEKALNKKSNKAGELQAELVQCDSTISSLTPMVYATFQRLDEERLRGLKEVCVRWATVRADMASRDGERAEQAAAQLLSWEPQDEVISVGLRLASAAGGRPSSRPAGNSTPPQSSTPRRMSVQTAATGTSDFTPRMSKANGSSSNVSTHGTGGGGAFGGIKSMLSRKATTAGRQRSGSEATSVRSNRRPTGDNAFEPVSEGPPERQLSTPVLEKPEPIPERPTREREPSTTQRAQTPLVDAEGYTIAPADRHKNPWEEPNENIPTQGPSSAAAGAAAGAAGIALPSAVFAGQRSSSPAQLHDSQSTSSSSIGETAPRLNLALAPTPIQESEEERTAALARMQQTLSMTPQPPTRRSTIARGRREARHTVQAGVAEGGPVPAVHMAALARMGEEERLADEPSTLAPRPDLMRRRSASSVSSRNPFDSPGLGATSSGLEPTTPALDRPPSRGDVQRDAALGGIAAGGVAGAGAAFAAGSHHAESNGGLPAAPAVPLSPPPPAAVMPNNQPPMAHTISRSISTVPGLRASITETVHALIRQNQLQRTMVNGEIRLSLAASPSQPLPPSGSAIHIRLTEFDALEAIFPNPAFLAQVPGSPGEYYLDADKIAQATMYPEDGSNAGPVLFRYNVLVPEGSESAVAPVIVNPAFQIKNGETRMILHYRLSPNSGVADLNLSVVFPSQPDVTTTQSKPVTGIWADGPDGNHAISYKVAPQEGVDNKIIARFLTSGPQPLSPTTINTHFTCPGRVLSGIGIETVDNAQAVSGWTFADISRSVVSGKYVGEPSLN